MSERWHVWVNAEVPDEPLITRPKLTVWAEKIGVTQAEHDYRLVMALKGISTSGLAGFAFKGGTALNKLYYGESNRLSVVHSTRLAPAVVLKRALSRRWVEACCASRTPTINSATSTAKADRHRGVTPNGAASQPIRLRYPS